VAGRIRACPQAVVYPVHAPVLLPVAVSIHQAPGWAGWKIAGVAMGLFGQEGWFLLNRFRCSGQRYWVVLLLRVLLRVQVIWMFSLLGVGGWS
jgi:hypothetical protein